MTVTSRETKPLNCDAYGFGGWIRETRQWFSESHAGHTTRFHNNESELAAMVMVVEQAIRTFGRCQTAIQVVRDLSE